MSTGWNKRQRQHFLHLIINLLGNEYWLEHNGLKAGGAIHYKPTGK